MTNCAHSNRSNNQLVHTVPDLCRMCYTCVRECPVKAIRIMDGQAEVMSERCIGCGNCVPSCPSEAIELKKREKETIPPKTDEDMFEIIMTNKPKF